MQPETIRPAAVAGTFYPADPAMLQDQLARYLADANAGASVPPPPDAHVPKAIIAPHAGYVYSGPVAGSAYAPLAPARDTVTRVILVGPAHFIPFHGLAASSADSFITPLGKVPLDRESIDAILTLPQVSVLDAAHRREHGLEVHLPFLQQTLASFAIVPLVFGDTSPAEIAAVLDALWGGDETLIVVSSDLSHYHDDATARQLDNRTAQAVENLDPSAIGPEQACGRLAIQALLIAAGKCGLKSSLLDLRNSGETAASAPHDRVVGYGAWTFQEP